VQPVKIKVHKAGPQTFALNKFEISVRDDVAEWIDPSTMFMIFYCWAISSITRFSCNSSIAFGGNFSLDGVTGRCVAELLVKFKKFMDTKKPKETAK